MARRRPCSIIILKATTNHTAMPDTCPPARFDAVVAEIYRAAAGEVPWGQPFQAISDVLDAWGVYMHGVRLADGAVAFAYEVGGFPPAAALEYVRTFHRIDPRMAFLAPLQPGEWASCHEHFDTDFVASNPFYQDFLIPVGGRYCSGAKIFQDDEVVVFMGVHRAVGMQPLEPSRLSLMKRFGAHIQTAIGLWRRQRELIKASLAGNALLDRLAQPILLIDEQLQLHYSNAAADGLLARDARLSRSGQSLNCQQRGGTQALMLALRRIQLGGGASYRAGEPAEQRALVRAGDGVDRPPLMLMLSALRPAETMGAFGLRALAMALIHDPAGQLQVDPFVAAEAYGLTPAESSVATAIVAGRSVQEIAVHNDVAISTIRSQLSTVMGKMGVKRQSEIVGALAPMALLRQFPDQ